MAAQAWKGSGLMLLLATLACGPQADLATPTPLLPTDTPRPTNTPEPLLEEIRYDDPPEDCILNDAQAPTPCVPQGFDLLRVVIRRGSPLVITTLLQRDGITSGGGFAELPDYVVVHGIDLDRDPTTGATGGWPEQHGVAPDLVFFYQSRGGQGQSGITQYAADGTSSAADASLAQWLVLEDYALELTISDQLVGAIDFAIAGDILGQILYDHYVDGGHLEFPSGEVILVPGR
ncbi:MAG: hypothetical protein WD906_01720 [Anaerolineales bacterium]